MHPELIRRFNEQARDEAAGRYGVPAQQLVPFKAFENFVFGGTNQDGNDIILRVSHSARRTLDYTMGEIEFVRFLAAAGLPVSKPILSDYGQFTEVIEDSEPGHYFVATAFEPGQGAVFDDAPAL